MIALQFFQKPIDNSLLGWTLYLLEKYAPLFLNGIKTTLIIALSGTIIGLVIGLLIGSLRAIKVNPKDELLTIVVKRLTHFITSVYVEVFRGTPMMVQAVFIYYSLKPIFGWTSFIAGIVVVSVNTGAYMAEIVRAGIQSVPFGQSEAATALGMTNAQSMMHVILPQAIRNTFPAIGNEFVVNIKDSSVLNVISVTEIYFQTASVAGSVMKPEPTFLISALIYFTLTFTVTRILRVIEKNMDTPKKSSLPFSQTTTETMLMGGKN
jgi:putative lysine transport system permease protein